MGKFSLSARLKSRSNKDGTHAIYVVYLHDRKPADYRTGISIDKASWDSVKKLAIPRTKEAVAANQTIQKIQAQLFSIASELDEPTHEAVKAAYALAPFREVTESFVAETQAAMKQIEANDGVLDDVFQTVENINDLVSLERSEFRELMVEREALDAKYAKSKIIQRLENKGIYKSDDKKKEEQAFFIKMQNQHLKEMDGLIKAGTLKQRKALFTNLNRFSAETNYPLTFEAIDLNFYKAYWKWVSITEDNGDNYFGSLIKRLKTFLGWCLEKNIKVNPQFNNKKFKIFVETIDVVYLKTEELEWLDEFRHHSACKPSWVRIIDMSLFQSSIGCRYSDMANASWFYDGDMLKGHTIKNDSKYIIPLKSSKWLQIIKSYSNMSFALPVRHSDKVKVLSEQKYNKYLKECLQAMYHARGLHIEEHEKLVKKVMKNNVPSFHKFYKHELITSHSMRRSFVSRMVRLGYKQEMVATMIGTRDLRELQKYFKLEEDDIRNEANRIHG